MKFIKRFIQWGFGAPADATHAERCSNRGCNFLLVIWAAQIGIAVLVRLLS